MSIGYKNAGYLGGIVAGVLLILPGYITLSALGWIYVHFGKAPQVLGVLWGFRPVGLALLLAALVRISRAALKGAFPVVLAVAAFVAFYVGRIRRCAPTSSSASTTRVSRDAAARLEYFHRRHPSWDDGFGAYPIVRVNARDRR